MPNRNSDTQPSRLRWAWAGMMEWSCEAAMPIPITIPAMTKLTASLKLSEDAVMWRFPCDLDGAGRKGNPTARRNGSYSDQANVASVLRAARLLVADVS